MENWGWGKDFCGNRYNKYSKCENKTHRKDDKKKKWFGLMDGPIMKENDKELRRISQYSGSLVNKDSNSDTGRFFFRV
jgi:hypothetical protein